MTVDSSPNKSESRKDPERPAAKGKADQPESAVRKQPLPTIEMPAVNNHEKRNNKQTSRLLDVNIIHKHLRKNGDRKDQTNPSNSSQQLSRPPSVNATSNNNMVQQGQWYPSKKPNKPLNAVTNSVSSSCNQPTSFDHGNSRPIEVGEFQSKGSNFEKSFDNQRGWKNRERKYSRDKQKPEISQGENGKLKEVEPCAHPNEEVKEAEDGKQKVQTTLSPPPQLEPATSVCAESTPVHPSERPSQSKEESSNAQPTTTTTAGSGFPVTYPPVPQFQHNSLIIVISPGMPIAISAVPKLTVFPPGSRLYLSDPRNHICCTSGYNMPDAPIRVPIHYSGPSVPQTTAAYNPQPINLGPGGPLPLHTSGGAINSAFAMEVLATQNFAPGSIVAMGIDHPLIVPDMPIVAILPSDTWIYLT